MIDQDDALALPDDLVELCSAYRSHFNLHTIRRKWWPPPDALRQRADLDLSELQMSSINRVLLTGNLTSDPGHRTLPSGTSLCRMRLASNTRRRTDSGWEEKPNYFDLVAWGGQADACARFLKKGSPVAVDGRLEWRQWETQEGQHRQAVEIVVQQIEFLPSGDAHEQTLDQAEPGDQSPEASRDLPF